MDRWMNIPEAIFPSFFFEVRGIINPHQTPVIFKRAVVVFQFDIDF